MARDLPRLLLTVAEAAGVLRISRSKAYELVRSGALPARKLGARTFLLWKDLEAFADGLPPKAGAPARADGSRATLGEPLALAREESAP